jgi:hypothetical protein
LTPDTATGESGRSKEGAERMSRVDDAGKLVAQLTPAELADFRQWFAAFDAGAWDRQIETDVASGKLDALAERALAAHAAGRSTKL